MARILRKDGLGLIYVWSHEHQKQQYPSQDAYVPWHLKQELKTSATIPEHAVNSEKELVLLRYYHLFVEGELEKLIMEDNGDEIGAEDLVIDQLITPELPIPKAGAAPIPSPQPSAPTAASSATEGPSVTHASTQRQRYPPLREVVSIVQSGFDHENWLCIIKKLV